MDQYFAGFVDAIGSMYLRKTQRDRHRTVEIRYVVYLSIRHRDLEALEHVRQHFGGSIYRAKGPYPHRWEARGHAATDLLRRIAPSLLLQRDRAQLILGFTNLTIQPGQFYSPYVSQLRERIYQALRSTPTS